VSVRLEGVSLGVGPEIHPADVDLELHPGLTVLLGPTLAGKTSLLRVLAGLDRPEAGRILVDGEDVTGRSVRERNVAMVYQQFINYPSFTVYENIASPLRRAGMARAEVDRRVRETATLLHIEGLLERLPAELSGGQQQRTALARALVKEAPLLLLDEPLVNLDYKLREELRLELQGLFRAREAVVVYATTEPQEALLLGGTTVVMDEGRVLQAGLTLEVYHRPVSVRVGQVFSDPPINMIDGTIEPGVLRLGHEVRAPLAGHLAELAPGPYRFGVRANHLGLVPAGPDDVEIGATVELAEISGSETFIHAAHADVSWVVQEEGLHGPELGAPVSVFLDPRRLFAFTPDGRLVAAPGPGGARAAA